MTKRRKHPRHTSEYQECQRKIPYADMHEATQALIVTEADGFKGKLHIYTCDFCKKLHVGHKKKNRKRR